MATYSEVSITGYNSNPPEDDGSAVSSNEVSWSKHKTKIGDPLKTAIEATQTNITSLVAALNPFLNQTGSVSAYAGSTAPTGWLLCDGSAVDRTTYADLFSVIGTTYGTGNGSTTFNLPDLGGRTIAGKESSATRLTSAVSGVDGATLGASGGDQRGQDHLHGDGTLAAASHAHASGTIGLSPNRWVPRRTSSGVAPNDWFVRNVDSSGGGSSIGVSDWSGSVAADNISSWGTTGSTGNSGSVDVSGSTANPSGTKHGGDSANVQPTIILNYIIKT